MKVNCDKEGISKANEVIKKGGVIVFPTDTVYGIGCDPYNESAVKRIYEIKSREKSKAFPVLVYSKEIASKIVDFDEDSEKIAREFWPGPLTLILRLTDLKIKRSLDLVEKIALRVPANQCTLKLLKKCNYLIGTSANISGQDSFTDPLKCYEELSGFDLFLDGGEITGGIPSTIVEVIEGKLKIYREGVLTKEDIVKIL